VDLVAIDGQAEAELEAYFTRPQAGARLDIAARAVLERCAAELDRADGRLEGDVERYFGRLRELIRLVLAERVEPDARLR
jgi:hypothetical protein